MRPSISQPALIAGVHPVSYSEGACILERFTFRCEVATFKPYCYRVVCRNGYGLSAVIRGRSCRVFNRIIYTTGKEMIDDLMFQQMTFNYDLSAATIKLLIN